MFIAPSEGICINRHEKISIYSTYAAHRDFPRQGLTE